MQYLLLIYQNETGPEMTEPAALEKMSRDYREFTQSIVKSGNMRAGDALQPTSHRDHGAGARRQDAAPPTARSPRPRSSSAATTWSRPRTSTRR